MLFAAVVDSLRIWELRHRRREKITKRGFRTAGDATRARREVVAQVDAGLGKPSRGGMTMSELLDLYLRLAPLRAARVLRAGLEDLSSLA